MSVYKHIKDGKYQIGLLKAKMSYVKTQQQMDSLVALTNVVINLLNTVEFLADEQSNVDAVDRLLLSRMYSQFYVSACEGNKINIKKVVTNIEDDLGFSKEFGTQRIVSLLKGLEVDLAVSDPAGADNTVQRLKNITPDQEWGDLIEGLLVEFKQHVKWN
tara:strand:+ start:10388 stop:10867 length:480 start_codon:yes stop_codon:yes gene_type:complete